jgi:glutathione-regulated potassium-efflux system ancillary protein KefG
MTDNSKRVLILFAHPTYRKSRVNRGLVWAVQNLDGVTFHDLYEAYPEFDIDVQAEQALLLDHDIVVFHHPFFWYSTPAILKEWQDLVLEHGWAYGSEGNALQGKMLFNAMTTGGSEDAYRRKGHNRFTIRELLAPIEQTANLCGMVFLPPFVVHGTHSVAGAEIREHAEDYRRLVEAFRDGRINFKALNKQPRANKDLDAVIIEPAGQ